MIMVGEKNKSEDVDDDYVCPACGVSRLAWQTECSECGKKFDEDIEVTPDEELEKAKRKEIEAAKIAKKKKGYWRNLDQKEFDKIKDSKLRVISLIEDNLDSEVINKIFSDNSQKIEALLKEFKSNKIKFIEFFNNSQEQLKHHIRGSLDKLVLAPTAEKLYLREKSIVKIPAN